MTGKRQKRLKELMRDRITIEQGFTLWQIFAYVYSDVVKRFHKENGLPDLSSCNSLGNYEPVHDKNVRRLIKHVRRTDDDFRWLSPVPCKDEKGKIKGYKYVNIKARNPDGSDSEFLSEVNEFWLKRAEARIRGIDRAKKRLEILSQMTEEQHDEDMKLWRVSLDYEVDVRYMCEKENIDKMVTDLRKEGRLRKLSADKYRLDYKKIARVVEKELLNKQVMLRDSWLTSEGKRPEFGEVWQSVKDTIATYCNHRRYRTKEELPIPTKLLKLEV